MVPRFGVVLAVLAAVRAADISLVTSPAGPIKQGDKVDIICTLPKGTKGRLDLVGFVRTIKGVDVQISTNSQLFGIFKTLPRYSVKYESADNGDVVLTLTINDITGADGGNIGCLVYKDKPVRKMMDLIVHVPVKDVTISLKGGDAIADAGELAGKAGTVAVCTVTVDGSDLAPTTKLTLGATDVTSGAVKPVSKPVKSAMNGLLQLSYSESLEYTIKPEDNGKKLTCGSETKEFPAVSKTVTISVQTAPTLNCEDKVYAKVESENFELSCKATGNPLPNSAKWTWMHDGTTQSVESGKEANGYKVAISNSDATTAEVKLTIPKVGLNDFHEYTVEVTNIVGSNSKKIELSQESSGSAETTTIPTTTKTIPTTTTQPAYVHVTEKPKEKVGPKEAASVEDGRSGAGSLHRFSAAIASILSLLVVCLI